MPAAARHPWRRYPDRIVMRVRVTPKGGRDSIDGLTPTPDGPAVKARVRAAPEDCAANAAVAALIAAWLGVAKRDVAIVSGHTSRVKAIAISGDPALIEQRLAAAFAP